MFQRLYLIVALAGLASQAHLVSGFLPISGKTLTFDSAVFNSESENSQSDEGQYNQDPSETGGEMLQPKLPDEIPPQPASTQPRPMDPLMASLTRVSPSTGNGPTRNVPIFGEIPVDGSLTVLAPAAAIAVLGFILSIVVAFNSQDEFVQIITQVSRDLTDQATEKSNMAYDDSVCRGLCSTQDQDLEGLRGFMESLKR